MFKRTAVLLSLSLFSLMALLWVAQSAQSAQSSPAPQSPAVITDTPPGGMVIQRNTNGVLATNNQAVFGPLSCSSMGDPFSPLNPNWQPDGALYAGIYTYQYRINIPADYPHDVVRVELFDPDSINKLNNNGGSYTTAVAHTNAWINSGRPAVEQLSCTVSNIDPCLIDTREDELLNLPLDQVNPWWFVRIDENRTGNGSGSGCGGPYSYTPSYNTQTRYELSYWAPAEDAYPVEIPLARYTGQVGDGVRDSGDHLTDMHWVSPGGQIAYDQPAPVPTEFGSFEVDLTQDTPDIIIDPVTGGRSLYLAVTAVSGASENGWDIWAGPPDYVDYISSDVNTRNIQILNDPTLHDSDGIEVFALNAAPSNNNYVNFVDIPLLDVGAENAGQDIYVNLFDADSGASPPTTFFFDTVPESDWSLFFGSNPAEHPDNAPDYNTSGRCVVGSCNNQWVLPPYKITIPTFDAAACAAEPDNQAVCTPFYGGRLMARYRAGNHDTYTWLIRQPESIIQPDQGCTAFPIAPVSSRRSLNQSVYNALAAQVSYPTALPAYDSFADHVPDVALTDASSGSLYWFSLDNLDAYALRWNTGIDPGGQTWGNSLAWPGNSQDYTDHGDSGTPLPPYPYVVRGYMEPGNVYDTALHLGDRITLNETAVLTNTAVQTSLQSHIDLNRLIRLPVTDFETPITLPDNTSYIETAQFGLFRIIGYSESNEWLLLTFIGWDASCGQNIIPLVSVSISGPVTGLINSSHAFTTTIFPTYATQPITTTWVATGQETITQTGGVTATQSWQWPSSGLKTITVTAQNASGSPVTATHQISIENPANLTIGPLELATTPPITVSTPVVFRATISNTGEEAITSQFYVDVFINPTHINDDYISLDQSSGYTAVSALAAQSSRVVTLTAPSGFPPDVITHSVYAMVDSLRTIAEPLESDNIWGPLTVTGILPPTPLITVTPTCSSTPTATITVNGAHWPLDEEVALYFDGDLRTLITDHDGSFNTSWLEQSISVGQEYEITAVSPSHSASTTFTTPCQPAGPESVTITGPAVGRIGEPLTFVAMVNPVTAVAPFTYTWHISGTGAITHTNGLSDTITASWRTVGPQSISLSVENEYGFAHTRFLFDIVEQQLFLPLVMKPEE